MNEDFITLTSLGSVVKDHLFRKDTSFDLNENTLLPDRLSLQHSNQDTAVNRSTKKFYIECVFVDSDQFYLEDNFSGRDSKSKSTSLKKMVKTSTQRIEEHLERLFTSSAHGEGCIVVAVNLPFLVLREFDSAAMFGSKQTIIASVSDILIKHSKYRKTLKTLAMCLDHLINRQQELSSIDTSGRGKSVEGRKRRFVFSAFIYSIGDDKYDLFQSDI